MQNTPGAYSQLFDDDKKKWDGVDRSVPGWVKVTKDQNLDYNRDDERFAPDHFQGNGDDKLMENLFKTYAYEGRDKKTGEPTGKHYLSKHAFEAVAKEVLNTHMKGAKVDEIMQQRVPELWIKGDVNGEDRIEVERVPPLLRSVIGDVNASFGL